MRAPSRSSSPAPERRWRPESGDWYRVPARRLFPAHDPARPHVRLGLAWFALVVASLWGGPAALAVPYGAAAGLGAAQAARAWRRVGALPVTRVAVGGAVLAPAGAAVAGRGLGAAVLLATAASVAMSPGDARAVVMRGGLSVRCWLPVGLAAASPVALARSDLGVAVALVVLVSAYDAGDYLFAAEASRGWVGIVGGALAVGVLAFALYVVALPPFGGAPVAPFALAVAVSAPLGQLVATWVLPDGRALASGLRRLDSLIVTGPTWLVLVHLVPLDG